VYKKEEPEKLLLAIYHVLFDWRVGDQVKIFTPEKQLKYPGLAFSSSTHSGTFNACGEVPQSEALTKAAIQLLNALNKDDEEAAHADGILCNLLTRLGYKEVVDAYRKVPKYFA